MSDALLLGASLARGFTSGSVAWPLARSSALFELRYGKALVETNRRPGTVPVFGTNGQCGTHDTHLLKGPGVVCGRKGQGPLGVEWVGSDYWVIDTAYSLTPLRNDIDLKFAYYLVKYVGLNHLKDGTSNPTLSRDAFGAQLFPIPPLADQHTIADVLVALDDKIELNRRTNETLEAMARALFKSWFVDFDPVRAKAEGRTPTGMDAETAALFPSELVDSELGLIPRGWATGSIYEVADVDYGAPYASKQFRSDGMGRPVIRIRDLISQSPSISTEEVHPRDVAVSAGDILVGMDGEFRATTWAGAPSLLNQRLCRFRPKADVSATFVRMVLEGPLAFVERTEVATTVIHLGKSDIDEFRVVQPSREALKAFGTMTSPIARRQLSLAAESRTLAALRDCLLPRLLSGELPACALAEKSATRMPR